MPELLDLSASPSLVWTRLADAVGARAPTGFKSLTLATMGADGSPQARTIVLRAADPTARALSFHADRTSAKVAELRRDPRATLLGWDADARLQLRIAASAAIHLDGAEADACWASQHASALDVYRQRLASGAAIDRPDDATRADAPQRERFALLLARVASIEWLWLGASGHRRGRWTFDGAGASHQLLVP